MAFGPTIAGMIHDRTETVDFGFYWQFYFFTAVCVVGTIINIWLVYEDVTGDRALTDVSKKKGITDMITSPKFEDRSIIE